MLCAELEPSPVVAADFAELAGSVVAAVDGLQHVVAAVSVAVAVAVAGAVAVAVAVVAAAAVAVAAAAAAVLVISRCEPAVEPAVELVVAELVVAELVAAELPGGVVKRRHAFLDCSGSEGTALRSLNGFRYLAPFRHLVGSAVGLSGSVAASLLVVVCAAAGRPEPAAVAL